MPPSPCRHRNSQDDGVSPIYLRLLERAEGCPDAPAIIDLKQGRTQTFKQLLQAVESALGSLAPVRGAVALAVRNSDLCPLFFAARRLGLTVVLMDAQPSVDDKRRLCRRLGIQWLVHSGAQGRPAVESVDGVKATPLPPGIDIVKLTSGSTGLPSGACFADHDLLLGADHIARGMEITERDRILMLIPLTHSYGFDNGVLLLATLGTPLILESRIFPGDILRALAAGDVTVLPLVPPLVRSLARADWPSLPHLRRVICAGAPLPLACARAFHEVSGVPVHNFYGSSESGGICFEVDPSNPEAGGTVGRPLPGVDVRLGANGRVEVRSEANRRAIWGAEQQLTGDRRTVYPGDAGTWAGERLKLTGRAVDLLNVGGRKIAAREIEHRLEQLPGVRQAVVIGMADAMRGDRLVAFLVADSWPISLEAVPRRMRPRESRRLDEMPTTARGKIDRAALRRLASAGDGAPPLDPERNA